MVRGYNTMLGTIRVNLKPLCKIEKVMQVNLGEEPLTALETGDDGSVTIDVHGHEIVSIMFSEKKTA